ncbi:MAG: hypothetical protein F4138_06315 [Acidimicrobiia bacterium]|nr:hypothetical protein [Acidimicrobiia bacterium]
MATIAQPSPAMYSAVLHVLGNTDPYTRSMSVTMSDLVEYLNVEQAACLPQAVGEVLPLLSKDPERLRFAAHLAVNFDLFEAAPKLAECALTFDDRELILAAAWLCGNPAVNATVRHRVANAVADDAAGLIRLDPTCLPKTEDEICLYSQCWPGVRTKSSPLSQTPVVVLDGGYPADAALRFAICLDKAGASVRRLSQGAEIPCWFGAQTVLVCQASTRSRVLNSYPHFPERQILVEAISRDNREIEGLLHRVNGALTGPHRLSLGVLGPEVEYAVWAPEVFTAGAYSTKEAAFLAGTTSSSLNRLRVQGVLEPRDRGILLWTFRDVVAVRTWVYLKSMTSRRVSSKVVKELARFAGHSKAVRLGATSSGRVLVDQGDGWDDVVSGQRVMGIDIIYIDEVFRPFDYGGGTTLDLLQASPNTKLYPTVLSGTPHFDGHRISAKALASLDTRGQREAIEAAYPELEGESFEDTVAVGKQLLSVA